MTECVTPTIENIEAFLRRLGPHTVDGIRFKLDSEHGCVWPASKVERSLASLVRDGSVLPLLDSRYLAIDSGISDKLTTRNVERAGAGCPGAGTLET